MAPRQAAFSMLCLIFFFLPFQLHKDVIIEGVNTQSTVQKQNASWIT